MRSLQTEDHKLPDPNPADHPENKPELPHDFNVADVGTNHIDVGWKWCISRLGRIPKETHGFVFEYDKALTLKQLFDRCENYYPQISPQPAFHATNVTLPWHPSEAPPKYIMPGQDYVLIFCSVNDAGRSPYFGTFDVDSGIIKPVKTKEEAHV
jgi:hypothetical protein